MIKGLFGRKKKPAFDPYNTPGIGDGLPGAGNLPQQAMEQPQKPGFFDQGGVGRSIAGSLGDYLLQYNGMNPIYAPQQQQQAYLQAQSQRDQAKRFAENSDWRMREDYKRENPAQTATMKDVEWLGGMSPEERNQALEVIRAKNPSFFTGWDGQRRQNPAPGPQPGTVDGGFRFRGGDPSDKNNWEPLGGQTPASGNFQR